MTIKDKKKDIYRYEEDLIQPKYNVVPTSTRYIQQQKEYTCNYVISLPLIVINILFVFRRCT